MDMGCEFSIKYHSGQEPGSVTPSRPCFLFLKLQASLLAKPSSVVVEPPSPEATAICIPTPASIPQQWHFPSSLHPGNQENESMHLGYSTILNPVSQGHIYAISLYTPVLRDLPGFQSLFPIQAAFLSCPI